MEKLALARAFAELVHAKHTYADGPYTDHLDEVEQILADAGMGTERDRIIARLHDSIEDIDEMLRKMAQDFVFTNFGHSIYSTVWALSGFGHNRKARNQHAYEKIARYPEAANYKVADRIANFGAAVRGAATSEKKLSKAKMYLKEFYAFNDNVVAYATNEKLIERYRALKDAATEVCILAA
jgi:(p)ppGpp synthase/HD superfamily hydrolase